MDRLEDWSFDGKVYRAYRNGQGNIELFRTGRYGIERIVTEAKDFAGLEGHFREKRPRWTGPELAFIRDNWERGDRYLAEELGRPISSVVKERERLGLLRKVPVSTVELRIVRDNPELRSMDYDGMRRRRVEYVRDVIRHSA